MTRLILRREWVSLADPHFNPSFPRKRKSRHAIHTRSTEPVILYAEKNLDTQIVDSNVFHFAARCAS